MATITFQPTRQDLIDAARLHAMAYVLGWRRLPLVVLFMIGVTILSFVVLDTRGRDPILIGIVAVALGVGLTVGALALRNAVLPRLVVRRALRERRRPMGEWNMLFSDRGYRTWGDTVSSDVTWDHFAWWRENARVILLYQGSTSYTYVPKRILAQGEASFIADRLRAGGVPQKRLILS